MSWLRGVRQCGNAEPPEQPTVPYRTVRMGKAGGLYYNPLHVQRGSVDVGYGTVPYYSKNSKD